MATPASTTPPKSSRIYLDEQTKEKVRLVAEDMSECVHILANEPVTGLYHVQNHIGRSVPSLVKTKHSLIDTAQKIENATYDLDYSLTTIRSLQDLSTFQSIQKMMDASLEIAKHIQQSKT
eukprot:TRINITY_DN3815_c0_g2_i1.p2 TRINITY_DN3815_c0_g2~~TRINITY_DN3815_c0_g2_i1.p2  ORF type:complete len:121 (-),score=19.64 TRINITY_DN3815_c0_g2_i1:21-383(-)